MCHHRPACLVGTVACLMLLTCACDESDKAHGEPDDDTTVAMDDIAPTDTGADDTSVAIDTGAPNDTTPPDPPCKPTPAPLPEAVQLPALDASIVLPDGFVVTEHAATTAVTFDDAALGAFGWLAEFEVEVDTDDDVAQANGLAVLAVGQAGHLPTVDFSKRHRYPGPEWSNDTDIGELPLWEGVRVQMRFAYGEGQPNTKLDTMPSAALRDVVVSALTGTSFDSSVDSARCETVSVYWHSRWRPERGRLLVGGIAACEDAIRDTVGLRQAFDTVFAGNWLAPAGFEPGGAVCQQGEAPPPPPRVDLVVVIDNSASMADERAHVSAKLDALLEGIGRSGLRWRVGVTTTEAWLVDPDIEPDSPRTDLTHDELIDPLKSGLREPGFIDMAAPDARDLVRRNVLHDEGCQAMAGDPPQPAGDPGDNLCGSGRERGLLSSLTVIERLADAETADDEPVEPHAFAARSSRVLMLLSDERDADAAALDDPRFDDAVTEMAGRFEDMRTSLVVEVGDRGVDNGGSCDLIASSSPDIEPSSGAEDGVFYQAVVLASGNGTWGSICVDSLPPAQQAWFSSAPDGRSYRSIPLTAFPVIDTLRVTHDGVEVPRSTTQGWRYNADTNSVVLNGSHDVTHESDIRVGYHTWQRVAE